MSNRLPSAFRYQRFGNDELPTHLLKLAKARASAAIIGLRYKTEALKYRPNRNTVYLSDNDGVAVDRWRVAVMRVFELVARHFAFDDAGIGTGAARR
jgi:hypothetical protein